MRLAGKVAEMRTAAAMVAARSLVAEAAKLNQRIFDRHVPATDEQRRALAHYREGRNAEEVSLVSYAVLSYFKIIELRHKRGEDVRYSGN